MDPALSQTGSTESMISEHDRDRLDELYGRLKQESGRFIGYPCNSVFDYSELYRFLEFPLNNVGDPFADSTYRVNTRDFEREVLSFFADLYRAPQDDYWGYMTSGGTEGNLYGLYLARELIPDGIVYYSEDTHYSVGKVLGVLGFRNIMIKRQENGEIDYEDLRETIRIHRDAPPVIFANIGTTMTGAVDSVATIRSILDEFALKRYYLHCDAALSGMILPFVKDPQAFTFEDGIDSISVSGHKMVGSPIPCGVVIAKKKNVDRIAQSVEYIGSLDTTIAGSRNGLSPLFLWYAIQKLGRTGFRDLVVGCLKMADYAIAAFREAGIEAWRNNNSVTVVFPRPADEVLKKWQIAVFHDIGHIITMPHIREAQIDELVADIAGARADS
ncbi:MAG: histidine decarboxylase [Planctomycetota bacterium]